MGPPLTRSRSTRRNACADIPIQDVNETIRKAIRTVRASVIPANIAQQPRSHTGILRNGTTMAQQEKDALMEKNNRLQEQLNDQKSMVSILTKQVESARNEAKAVASEADAFRSEYEKVNKELKTLKFLLQQQANETNVWRIEYEKVSKELNAFKSQPFHQASQYVVEPIPRISEPAHVSRESRTSISLIPGHLPEQTSKPTLTSKQTNPAPLFQPSLAPSMSKQVTVVKTSKVGAIRSDKRSQKGRVRNIGPPRNLVLNKQSHVTSSLDRSHFKIRVQQPKLHINQFSLRGQSLQSRKVDSFYDPSNFRRGEELQCIPSNSQSNGRGRLCARFG